MKLLNAVSLILIIIGGINYGLIGFFQFNLINLLLGQFLMLTKIIYCLIGIASLYSISFFIKERVNWFININAYWAQNNPTILYLKF